MQYHIANTINNYSLCINILILIKNYKFNNFKNHVIINNGKQIVFLNDNK